MLQRWYAFAQLTRQVSLAARRRQLSRPQNALHDAEDVSFGVAHLAQLSGWQLGLLGVLSPVLWLVWHSEILQYLSLHSASTLAVLSNLIVYGCSLLLPYSQINAGCKRLCSQPAHPGLGTHASCP